MKFAIEHSKTKRQIDGVFQIYGSRTDFIDLVRQLNGRLADDSWSHGWVVIYPPPSCPMIGLKPKNWDE